MSGYRTIHRYNPNETNNQNQSIWSLNFSPCTQSREKPKPPLTSTNPPHRLLTSHSDGIIRTYSIMDKSVIPNQAMSDASAVVITKQSELRALSKKEDTFAPQLGSCQLSTIRNYLGESEHSGDEIVASISLDGWVRIWKRDEQPIYNDDQQENANQISHPIAQFYVDQATGTNLALSPACWGGNDLIVGVGCRDGSIVLYHTGISVNSNPVSSGNKKKSNKPLPSAGDIHSQITSNKVTVTSITFSPNGKTLAVGRKDGCVDIYSSEDFRPVYHTSAHLGMIRVVQYTSDGALLLTGGDDGKINAYDIIQRSKMSLVNQFVGHCSWILDIAPCPDGKRFASSSSDKTVRIWDLSMRDSVHTFDGHSDQVWGVSFNQTGTRLASCGDDGIIQIYSCDL